jgi:hypothetical protein
MTKWFDEITKTLADDKLSRRQVMRKVAGTIAGAALASFIPAEALAARKMASSCPGPAGNCTSGFQNCGSNSNCYGFTDVSGKGVCGCNTYCTQAPPCSNDSSCGSGGVCIGYNGCTGCGSAGACIKACCGSNSNCQLSAGAGRTAAHV